MAAKLSLVLCVVAMCALINMGHGASSPRRNAPAPAPAPAVDCASLVLTMADCLSFVSNGSNTTKPEGTCCAGLKNVMKTSPQCLCEAFRSSAQFGVVLNVTRAKSLPAACKLSSSPVGDCGLSEAPGAAPGGSQSGESSPSPALGGELSPATAPTPGKNSASELHPISATSLLISMLVAAFSAFGFQHS